LRKASKEFIDWFNSVRVLAKNLAKEHHHFINWQKNYLKFHPWKT